jgi:N-acetylneuraminic acid mutarotase
MLRPQRLATLSSAVCVDGTPTAPTNGSWSAGANMPQPQSEHAVAAHAGKFYAVGGFGDPRGFKRYDPANNTWQELPDLPGGRDHLLAAVMGNEIVVAGGNNQGGDVSPVFHYSVAQNTWQSVADVPGPSASGSASLNGYLYFGSDSGDVFQYDPRRRVARALPTNTGVPRDHSQLVAFAGEVWLMGGRGPGVGETSAVAIFDPASETWRVGPSMRAARGGFAAATDGTRLFVAGGEVIFSSATLSVVNRVDAIALGQSQWSVLPNLPVSVHGVGGAVLGNAFYLLGGSTLAGGIRNNGEVQIYRWNP